MLDLIHRFISFVKEKEEVVKNGVTKTVMKEKMISHVIISMML